MFSRKQEPASRPGLAVKPMAGNASTFSVIGADVTITGNISASTELHVDGRIDGDIACASLVQGESSVIAGAIEAESARLAGTVKGSITARALVILRSARIEGDVHYEALSIEEGAAVEGHFAHRVPGQPAARSQAAAAARPIGDDAVQGDPQLSIAS